MGSNPSLCMVWTLLNGLDSTEGYALYSTVTDLARLRGWSTLQPRITAIW